jgi:hypothetical protein
LTLSKFFTFSWLVLGRKHRKLSRISCCLVLFEWIERLYHFVKVDRASTSSPSYPSEFTSAAKQGFFTSKILESTIFPSSNHSCHTSRGEFISSLLRWKGTIGFRITKKDLEHEFQLSVHPPFGKISLRNLSPILYSKLEISLQLKFFVRHEIYHFVKVQTEHNVITTFWHQSHNNTIFKRNCNG